MPTDDIAARAIAEAQVEADQLVAATRAALAADGDLLAPPARREIDDAIAESCAIATRATRRRSPPPSTRSIARPASSPRSAWIAALRGR